jgi:hypothetical protein
MDELLARQFGDAAWFGAHRLFVDAYSLQHPDRYCVSFKSLAAHAVHLCWSLERGGTAAVPCESIRLWVERHPRLEKPVLPGFRGSITIADVARASTPGAHRRAVEQWARATWDAHDAIHATVREWVDEALALQGGRGRRRRSGAPIHPPRRPVS